MKIGIKDTCSTVDSIGCYRLPQTATNWLEFFCLYRLICSKVGLGVGLDGPMNAPLLRAPLCFAVLINTVRAIKEPILAWDLWQNNWSGMQPLLLGVPVLCCPPDGSVLASLWNSPWKGEHFGRLASLRPLDTEPLCTSVSCPNKKKVAFSFAKKWS